MRGAVIVLARAPVPGDVKTRMSPLLSPAEACDLYACMLDDVLDTTARAARALDLEAVLAVHPSRAVPGLARRVPRPFRVVAQQGADLSARMTWAVAEAAAAGAAPILLRGSDSPVLGASVLVDAARALDEADLALCPDADGGYSLVALRRPVPGLFDHPMSHADVLTQTRARAGRHGLRTRLLAPAFDLDTAGDLRLLDRARERGETLACPRTLAWLDENAVWERRQP
jgi:rSAM/selenodomain-associated transferase 1